MHVIFLCLVNFGACLESVSRFEPVLPWYGECMVSIVNINNGNKALTRGYQNCNIRK